MTLVAEAQRTWFDPLSDLLARFDRLGAFVVCFPDYRPDLVHVMAYGLGLAHFDFRAKVMQPLGWKAHRLEIRDLELALHKEALEGSLVAQNVEALLSTKPAGERTAWLRKLLESSWPHAVVVPLFLYGGLVPAGHPRVLNLLAEDLPEQTLLSRLRF